MLQSARAAGERVFDILDTTEERARHGGAPLREPVRGEVVYENVSFSYDADSERRSPIRPKARPTRTPVEVGARHRPLGPAATSPSTPQPGEMIALVGPTGAGKSTLVNLLPAFYEATSGRIRLTARTSGTLTLESLRHQISVVSQEPFLFNGTIRENILYGKLDATEAELIAAAQGGELPRLHRPSAGGLRHRTSANAA